MTLVELKKKAAAHWQSLSDANCCVFLDSGSSCASDTNAAVFDHLVAEIAELKLNARVIPTGSLGWREIEPVLAIQKPGMPRIYYANVTLASASDLIRDVIAGDDLRHDLALAVDSEFYLDSIPPLHTFPFFAKQARLISRQCGRIAAEDIEHAIALGAYEGLRSALSTEPQLLLEQMESTFGVDVIAKWRVCQSSTANGKYAVAKVAEGGAISKDVYLLEGDPHSVLEGLLIAAYAVGASRAYICIAGQDKVAGHLIQTAIEQMKSAGLVGQSIAGSNFTCTIDRRDVQRGLGGEEDSILVNFLDGLPARASVSFPRDRDCHERAVVEGAEMLAKVAAVMRDPSQNAAASASKLLTLSGNFVRTGVVEVATSTSLRDVVQEIAGGGIEGCELKAVQIGAPTGGWVPASNLDIGLDEASLVGAGCSLGSHSLVAADSKQCAVELARNAAVAAQHGSCGQCTFGREGTRQLMDVLTDLTRGRAKDADIALLSNISDSMKLGSICINGRKAPDAVVTTLQHFRAEYEAHVNGKHCPSRICEMK